MASAPRRLQFLLTMWDEDEEAAGSGGQRPLHPHSCVRCLCPAALCQPSANSSSRAEGAGDCPDGCLSPGMLALGLVLMALFFVPVCVRFYRTRSCTDCSERRAKQMANGGDP